MSQGYLTFAINNDNVDYVRLAYLQALSIKATQKNNQYAVVVKSLDHVDKKYQEVFDHIIELPNTTSKFDHEYRALSLSPFKETIKVEADILFTRSIDHWWNYFDNDVIVTNHVMTYYDKLYSDRSQRGLFDNNNLPDVYSGLVFFRYSRFAVGFFNLVRDIYLNWAWFRDSYLKNCRYEYPVTDEVYAIACKILGTNLTTSTADFPTFVHMKPAGQNLHDNKPWFEQVYVEKNQNDLTVGFFRQYLPFHYVDKTFASEELIASYERRI